MTISVKNCHFSRSSSCRGGVENTKLLPRHQRNISIRTVSSLETTGAIGTRLSQFFSVLGRKTVFDTGQCKTSEWVYQRISVAANRDNTASIIFCTPGWVSVLPHSQYDTLVHGAVFGMVYGLGVTCTKEVGAGTGLSIDSGFVQIDNSGDHYI